MTAIEEKDRKQAILETNAEDRAKHEAEDKLEKPKQRQRRMLGRWPRRRWSTQNFNE